MRGASRGNLSQCRVVNFSLCMGCGWSRGGNKVGADVFQRRADECRRLAAAARNASDKAFWLGLMERWQTLESRDVPQPVRRKPKHQQNPELPPDRRPLAPSPYVR